VQIKTVGITTATLQIPLQGNFAFGYGIRMFSGDVAVPKSAGFTKNSMSRYHNRMITPHPSKKIKRNIMTYLRHRSVSRSLITYLNSLILAVKTLLIHQLNRRLCCTIKHLECPYLSADMNCFVPVRGCWRRAVGALGFALNPWT
jgi:hypothetical protein